MAEIRYGAMLHDIGKLVIPDHILDKQGPLTESERAVIMEHPEAARKLLKNISFLSAGTKDIPVYHHERWDGSGYPLGLVGTSIPFNARLFAIVDVWEAMTHKRVYKPAFSEASVLAHIRENAGTLFDPQLALFFVENYEAIKHYGTATSTTPSLKAA